MSALVWILFGVTVVLDVWGQTAFKIGLTEIENARQTRPFWMSVGRNLWVMGGCLGYALEACCWMYVVGHAPLSVVGPMAALFISTSAVPTSRSSVSNSATISASLPRSQG